MEKIKKMSLYKQLKEIEASAPFKDEALELIDKFYRGIL